MALVQHLVRNGMKLHEHLARKPEDAASTFLQTLYAMRRYHHGHDGKGAVHRDIPPANILVDDTGLVKVIDFGLAVEAPRKSEVFTKTGPGFGTEGCSPPEQFVNRADGRP